MMKSFLVGLITGAAAVWMFRNPIAARIDRRTRPLRARAAHRLHAVADSIDGGAAPTSPTGTPTPFTRISS
jgi:hypothetical protein